MSGLKRHRAGGYGLAAVALLVAVAACGSDEPAADASSPASDVVAESAYDAVLAGRAHYVRYCASCHGEDGTGNGLVAEALKTPPTDMTQIRSEAGGGFPVYDLTDVIRGIKDVRAHGTREMPVWGNIWGPDSGRDESDELVEARINELIEYIRSIQVVESPTPS